MDVTSRRGPQAKKAVPYNKREAKLEKSGVNSTEKGVKPVAKDTNKTRRKTTKKRITGETVAKVKPVSNLKKDLKKPNSKYM